MFFPMATKISTKEIRILNSDLRICKKYFRNTGFSHSTCIVHLYRQVAYEPFSVRISYFVRKLLTLQYWEMAFRIPILLLNHKIHICLEYHSVCPLVGIVTPHPLSRKRVCPDPGGHPRLRVGGGGGVLIQTTGQKPSTLTTPCFELKKIPYHFIKICRSTICICFLEQFNFFIKIYLTFLSWKDWIRIPEIKK